MPIHKSHSIINRSTWFDTESFHLTVEFDFVSIPSYFTKFSMSQHRLDWRFFLIKPPAFAGATLGECGQAFRRNLTWSMCQAWSLSHSWTVTNCPATLS